MLDEPAALAGDRRQPRLRVDGDREADRFEHRQVARRVGVGDRLGEVEPFGGGVVGHHLGSRLAGRRDRRHLARVRAVRLHRHLGGDDLVEQWAQAVDGEVEGAGDQDRAVAEGAVLAHAPDSGGKALREDHVAEQFARLDADLLDRGVLVAPVEVAEEVGAVGPVELEQPRRLGGGAQHVAQRSALSSRRVARNV